MNSKSQLTAIDSAEVVVPCIELDPTLAFFTSELGFRIEMITPADNPNTAIISGYGLRLCLRVGGSGKDVSLRLRSATRSLQLLQAPNGTQIEIISATSQVVLPPLQEALVISEFASESPWLPWRFSGFVSRNTGIDKATNGLASAETVRGEVGATIIDDKTSHELFFVFVLNGVVSLSTKKSTQKTVLKANSSVALPSNCDFKLEITSPNTELLVVSQP